MTKTNRVFFYPVSGTDDGKSVEQFLLEQGVSARLLVRLKQTEEGLLRGGIRLRSTTRLSAGETLQITLPPDPARTAALEIPVPILYEDGDLLVVDKPAELVVHRSGSHQRDTLENALGGVLRAMNRLDRDTSGAIVLAKHQLAAGLLWQKIEKSYLAVTKGGFSHQTGEIRLPIGRETAFEPRQIVTEDGLPSCTQYCVLADCGTAALVRCRPLTGRMHQIRVHFSAMGHPLLGDRLYGGAIGEIERQALHCEEVSFLHPISRKLLRIQAPLPKDFADLCAKYQMPIHKLTFDAQDGGELPAKISPK